MSSPIQTLAIIGGGIGGLNLAQALRRYNPSLRVTIYERIESREHKPQGWHLGINEWGLESLKEAQIDGLDSILEKNLVTGFIVYDEYLNELLRIGGPARDNELPKHATAIIHRTLLHNQLEKGLEIVYNKKFVKYEEHEDRVEVFFEDGTNVSADLLVGADGCWSLVRTQLAPGIVYSSVGVSNFGAVINAPTQEEIPTLYKALSFAMLRTSSPTGYSVLMGICQDEGDEKHMFFGLSWPDSIQSEPVPTEIEGTIHWAKQIVEENFHAEVALVFNKITAQDVILGGIRHVHTTNYQAVNPLKSIPHQRVTLLGDAAHAMTTNKGMGANTALKDSIDLAKALSQEDWRQALTEYEETMWKRGSAEVKDSLANTWRNHNIGLQFSIGKIFMRCLNAVFTWRNINHY
ncbi:FAD/NAD(P)-binding domain-containing protein [Basidiobolus meristosporus CBS 931.73]|uniref:FAD/NAD(P)-binding domain-containing protein n=1 Tax=Basidiobolus meristosporus CBS 931.73 TaxID=1314790 RepID=A0A1Y1YP66_9FUNG|nr:FAD/NAD(P)-binding domain-containing protein [Basidiobolus meristosporus CBS 931.73]|eukprot:ORX99792.1 FAD/NAD(P)-binding domain-containing protein [Basidiobolus meristosporus CBS 931.73]